MILSIGYLGQDYETLLLYFIMIMMMIMMIMIMLRCDRCAIISHTSMGHSFDRTIHTWTFASVASTSDFDAACISVQGRH